MSTGNEKLDRFVELTDEGFAFWDAIAIVTQEYNLSNFSVSRLVQAAAEL